MRIPANVDTYRDDTTTANSFRHQFILYFSTDAKRNQWTRELQSVRQKEGESIETYTNRFRKLLNRATQGAALADRYQVNYYMNGLLPTYVSQVVLASPGNLNAAVTRAKLVETGIKITLQNAGLTPPINAITPTVNANTTTVTPIAPISAAPTPEATLDELTKQIQQLSLNYANLYSAFIGN